MTDAQKLITVQTLLGDGSGYMPSDEVLNAYLTIAGNEILEWRYGLNGGVPESITEVPSRFEGNQIYAVVVGWTHAGTEGQGLSIENGVHRDFKYSDMLDYIHKEVPQLARVGAVSTT